MGCFLNQFSAGALSIIRCIEGVNYLSDLVIGEKFRDSIGTKDQGAISIELSFNYFYIWSWYYSKFLSYCVSEGSAHRQTWAIIIFRVNPRRPYLPSLMIFIMIDPSIHTDYSLTLSSHVRFVISTKAFTLPISWRNSLVWKWWVSLILVLCLSKNDTSWITDIWNNKGFLCHYQSYWCCTTMLAVKASLGFDKRTNLSIGICQDCFNYCFIKDSNV